MTRRNGMLEKDIEKILISEIKKLGGKAYKFISPGNSGVPDRIVVLPGGKIMFVELKTKTGSLSVLQSVQVKRLDLPLFLLPTRTMVFLFAIGVLFIPTST